MIFTLYGGSRNAASIDAPSPTTPPEKLRVASVAAADAVLAQNPDVAEHRLGLDRNRRNDLFIGIIGSLENDVDLAACKAGQRQVEVDIERADLVELEPEDLDVPSGIQRDLVVGKAERLLLRFAEPRQLDCRAPRSGRSRARRATARGPR